MPSIFSKSPSTASKPSGGDSCLNASASYLGLINVKTHLTFKDATLLAVFRSTGGSFSRLTAGF